MSYPRGRISPGMWRLDAASRMKAGFGKPGGGAFWLADAPRGTLFVAGCDGCTGLYRFVPECTAKIKIFFIGTTSRQVRCFHLYQNRFWPNIWRMLTLDACPLFQQLAPLELHALRTAAMEWKFTGEQEIFKEGDTGDGVYVVK